jgi:hypothetical protein
MAITSEATQPNIEGSQKTTKGGHNRGKKGEYN